MRLISAAFQHGVNKYRWLCFPGVRACLLRELQAVTGEHLVNPVNPWNDPWLLHLNWNQ